MCAKVAGLVLKVLSDLLGHENREVPSQRRKPRAWGRVAGGTCCTCPLPSICISYVRAFIIFKFWNPEQEAVPWLPVCEHNCRSLACTAPSRGLFFPPGHLPLLHSSPHVDTPLLGLIYVHGHVCNMKIYLILWVCSICINNIAL